GAGARAERDPGLPDRGRALPRGPRPARWRLAHLLRGPTARREPRTAYRTSGGLTNIDPMILIDGVRSVVLLGGDTVSGQRKLRRWAAVAALAVTAAAVVYAGGDEAAAAVPPAEVIAVAPT